MTVGYVALLFELNATFTVLPTETVFAPDAVDGEPKDDDDNAMPDSPVTWVVLMNTLAVIVPAVVWKYALLMVNGNVAYSVK